MTEGGSVHTTTLAVGLGSVAMVIGLRWVKNRLGMRLLPDLLITVLAMAAIVAWLGLDARGVAVVGKIPDRFPIPQAPGLNLELMRELSGGALAIAILGLLEAVAMAKALAARTRQTLDMNQLCLSEGIANFTGSFFQCYPGSGSLTRSAINQQAGAVTQWAGIVSAAAVALIVVAFAPYARFIPRAALAGILIVSAWRMIDRHALVYHLRASRFDMMIVAVTAFSAVAISIEFCVLIGVFMSFLLSVARAGRMQATQFSIAADGAVQERLPGDRAAAIACSSTGSKVNCSSAQPRPWRCISATSSGGSTSTRARWCCDSSGPAMPTRSAWKCSTALSSVSARAGCR